VQEKPSPFHAQADNAGLLRESDDSLAVVQIDGLVVLKIIKHCKENLPELVTGQLLGLDFDSTLEVTNCFPFPRVDEEDDADAESGVEYQIEMMKCLREVNVDSNTVGWYQTTYLSSFLNESMIETQFNYQATISEKCVVLIYDPMRSRQGTLWLKAYRLSRSAMDFYRKNPPGTTTDAKITFTDIFEEVPIKLHNSHLVTAFLADQEQSNTSSNSFSVFDLSHNNFFSRNLEFMIEALDDLASEQNKLQQYQKSVQRQQYIQKKKAEKKDGDGEDDTTSTFKTPQEPNRLDSVLLTNQITKYCQQVNMFAGQSSAKLFLLGGLHKH